MFWSKTSHRECLERHTELEEQIFKLRRDMQALQLDWENTYDKLKTMMQRVAKRHEAVLKAEDTTHTGGAAEAGNGAAPPLPTGHMLTERQMEVQRQVLRRRGALQ